MVTKAQLAILLSKLKVFDKPSLLEEQYPVDSEVAAEALWFAHMQKDIGGKDVADFGCGTGLLGIGALLLGARKAIFVDSDAAALGLLRQNVAFAGKNTAAELKSKAELLNQDIKDFNEKVDVVVQNPPFGTKQRHADRPFLEKAFESASVVYSFHKLASAEFLERASRAAGFRATHLLKFSFPLKRTMPFHNKKIQRIEVGCWRMEKQNGQ